MSFERDGGVSAGCGSTCLPLSAPDTAGRCRRPSPPRASPGGDFCRQKLRKATLPPQRRPVVGVTPGVMREKPGPARNSSSNVGGGVLDGPPLASPRVGERCRAATERGRFSNIPFPLSVPSGQLSPALRRGEPRGSGIAPVSVMASPARSHDSYCFRCYGAP